jgi:hypothetical protein
LGGDQYGGHILFHALFKITKETNERPTSNVQHRTSK